MRGVKRRDGGTRHGGREAASASDRRRSAALAAAALAALTVANPAAADPAFTRFERPAGFTRDADLNRAITRSPIGASATAIAQGNLVSIQQEGRGNTIVLNLEQTNTGAVSANAALNGTLDLD